MSDQVVTACEACFDAEKGDCSGFVRAVAGKLGVALSGDADAIVETLRGSTGWTPLTDGVAAETAARAAQLVIAGMKGDEQAIPNEHGHVVVVVAGALDRGTYPTAYWGSLGGEPGRAKTLNYAWTADDRDRVSYAAHDIAPA